MSTATLTDRQQAEALMWVAEHAALLGVAYSVDATSGSVAVQGCAGSLRGLVARFDAQPTVNRADGYLRWRFTTEAGVDVRLAEEPAAR